MMNCEECGRSVDTDCEEGTWDKYGSFVCEICAGDEE